MQSANDITQKTEKTLNNSPHQKTKANQQWLPQHQGTPNVFGSLKPPVHLSTLKRKTWFSHCVCFKILKG